MVGIAEATARVTVETSAHDSRGTYSIALNYQPFPPGKQHSSTCDHRNGCMEQDLALYVQSCLPPGGRFESTREAPNQMHGAINDVKTHPVGRQTVTESWIVNWDVSRQGTAK